ncbi:hypothetical protein PG991_009605, partial [Apiospora marii]
NCQQENKVFNCRSTPEKRPGTPTCKNARLQRALDHVSEAVTVAAAVVGEGLVGREGPAVAILGRLGEDEDEPLLLRLAVFARPEGSARRPDASMQYRGRQVGRHIVTRRGSA